MAKLSNKELKTIGIGLLVALLLFNGFRAINEFAINLVGSSTNLIVVVVVILLVLHEDLTKILKRLI